MEVRRDEPRIGTRKLHHRLALVFKAQSIALGRDRLFALLRSRKMLVSRKKRFQKTTNSNHSYAVVPNRIKALSIKRPNQVIASDITYLTLNRGFAYLFLVTDLYSRKVLGYHLSRDLSHHSALLALHMAVSKVSITAGMIHHSDRGCQYCCHEYLAFLKSYDIIPSMTDEAHCYQNAIAERVNGILKNDLNLDAVFANFCEAKTATDHAIRVYNTKRTHWSLDLQTPTQRYQQAA
jgi:putative transposase